MKLFHLNPAKWIHILSDLASLMLHFKNLRDKNLVEEDILERIITIYEHLQSAVVTSRIDNNKIGHSSRVSYFNTSLNVNTVRFAIAVFLQLEHLNHYYYYYHSISIMDLAVIMHCWRLKKYWV